MTDPHAEATAELLEAAQGLLDLYQPAIYPKQAQRLYEAIEAFRAEVEVDDR